MGMRSAMGEIENEELRMTQESKKVIEWRFEK
jgi:hypothetical protein